MHPLDRSARDALAAYKRSRSPDEGMREANWAAIANAVAAEEIAGPSGAARRGLTTWIALGATLAAAAGLVAVFTLAPRRAEQGAEPPRSVAAYAETAEPAPRPAAERDEDARPHRRAFASRAVEPEALAEPAVSEAPGIEIPDAAPTPAPAAELRVKAPERAQTIAPAEPPIEAVETLRKEAALVRSIRAAVAEGRTQRAIELVEQYRDDFPEGTLAEEIDALELAALCKAGPEAAWRKAIDTFEARHPRSPLRAGVRDDCFDAR